MRSRTYICALGGAAFALAAVAGCGSDPNAQVDLAKLPPPSQETIDRAKAQPLPKLRPKFGAPPKSSQIKP